MPVIEVGLSDLLAPLAGYAPLVLRLTLGSLFIIHGYPKLTSGRKMTQGFMKQTGMPVFIATFAGVAEFFGGLGILVGFLTTILAILFALWMLSTMIFLMRKLKKKYMGGWELDLTLLLASVALALLGPGSLSLDKLLGI